jgi:hypothetical protein
LLPKWSGPQRITSRNLNAYTLETLQEDPVQGNFSARRLRRFIPPEGSKLAEEQAAIERRHMEEEKGQKDEETRKIAAERNTGTHNLRTQDPAPQQTPTHVDEG